MIPDGAIVAHHQLLSYASALGQSGVHLTVDLSTRFPADTAPAFISVAAFTNLTFAPVKMPVAMWADQFAPATLATLATDQGARWAAVARVATVATPSDVEIQ